MRRDTTRLLVLVGIGWLCVTGTVFADDRNPAQQTKHENQGYHGHHGNQAQRVSAPEIDVGAAAGALTLAAGALTLLGERLRRS